MKNKFLVMAVVFSMLSLLILPAAFSATTTTQPEISGEVTTGTLTLTAVGDYAASTINLDTLDQTELITTITASYTSEASGAGRDVLEVFDGTDVPGYTLNVKMDSSATTPGDFDYSGTAGTTTYDIPVSNFSICADNEAAADFGVQSVTADNITGSYTQTLIKGSSAVAARSASLYSFSGSFTSAGNDYCLTMSDANQKYASSGATGVNKSVYQLRKLRLDVPGGSPGGFYKSTLLITLVDG